MSSNATDPKVKMSLKGSTPAAKVISDLVQQVFPDTQPEPSNTMVYIVDTARRDAPEEIGFSEAEQGPVTVTLDMGPDADLTVEEGAEIPGLDGPHDKVHREISRVYYVAHSRVVDGAVGRLELTVHPWVAYRL